jgi:hypothetical protein
MRFEVMLNTLKKSTQNGLASASSDSAFAHSLEKASARSLISFQASAIEFLGLIGG